jgi:putative flippase GtrA
MNLKPHIQILSKFFGVGVLATFLHGAIFSFCIAGHIASPQVANLWAYLVAVIFSYTGQRYWTFSPGESQGHARSILRFLGVSLLAYGLNAFWVYATTFWLSLSPYYALLGIGFVTPLVAFVLLRLWVFRA